MDKKLLLFFVLTGACFLSKAQAQDSLSYFKTRPDPFVSYFNFGLGSTGVEGGFSVRFRKHVSTGLFFHAFWDESGPLYDLESSFLVGYEAKFYPRPSTTSFNAGPWLGLDDFGSGLRPLLGFTTGFDHFGGFTLFQKYTSTRVGIALKGGLDTKGDGYIGIGFSVGLGYLNNGDIKSDHPPPPIFN